jgi:four helix bundle protein
MATSASRRRRSERHARGLPFHRLAAYQVATELLLALRTANIRDAKLRDEALRAAKSTCCNIAEATGRVSKPDKSRAFTIARGEALEAFAALEVAGLCGDVEAGHVERCLLLTDRPYALLTGLLA